ncbi:hexokinase A [Puccinia graminis f. sp. tritici]|uniref:Hexokinase A n=1 Tax=Puccinia graminis f. sp. tritici TaxID=56615 RepID=A0A5B0PQW3_PUCGR|nr:hexokinase A [Puccinia graminis f. sp. tritici]
MDDVFTVHTSGLRLSKDYVSPSVASLEPDQRWPILLRPTYIRGPDSDHHRSSKASHLQDNWHLHQPQLFNSSATQTQPVPPSPLSIDSATTTNENNPKANTGSLALPKRSLLTCHLKQAQIGQSHPQSSKKHVKDLEQIMNQLRLKRNWVEKHSSHLPHPKMCDRCRHQCQASRYGKEEASNMEQFTICLVRVNTFVVITVYKTKAFVILLLTLFDK